MYELKNIYRFRNLVNLEKELVLCPLIQLFVLLFSFHYSQPVESNIVLSVMYKGGVRSAGMGLYSMKRITSVLVREGYRGW